MFFAKLHNSLLNSYYNKTSKTVCRYLLFTLLNNIILP